MTDPNDLRSLSASKKRKYEEKVPSWKRQPEYDYSVSSFKRVRLHAVYNVCNSNFNAAKTYGPIATRSDQEWAEFLRESPIQPAVLHSKTVIANKDVNKKRKRKPRFIKEWKTRALTDEGRAYAKAIEYFPGGACDNCKQMKIKARDSFITNLVFISL